MPDDEAGLLWTLRWAVVACWAVVMTAGALALANDVSRAVARWEVSMNDNAKRYSSIEVLQMVWAVLDALDRMRAEGPRLDIPIPNNVIADAVRLQLDTGISPIGLRAVARLKPAGGVTIEWHGTPVTR